MPHDELDGRDAQRKGRRSWKIRLSGIDQGDEGPLLEALRFGKASRHGGRSSGYGDSSNQSVNIICPSPVVGLLKVT